MPEFTGPSKEDLRKELAKAYTFILKNVHDHDAVTEIGGVLYTKATILREIESYFQTIMSPEEYRRMLR